MTLWYFHNNEGMIPKLSSEYFFFQARDSLGCKVGPAESYFTSNVKERVK